MLTFRKKEERSFANSFFYFHYICLHLFFVCFARTTENLEHLEFSEFYHKYNKPACSC